MPEHWIRLRGGWESDLGLPTGRYGRCSLPMVWPAGVSGPVRLLRRFSAPPLSSPEERLELQIEGVPGLIAVWLNGRELARPSPGTSTLRIELAEPLPGRNLLTLEVDPLEAARSGPEPWGKIALGILTSGESDPRSASAGT